MDHYEYYSLLKVVSRFLKVRDRSSQEVRSFFVSKGYSESKIEKFIEELRENNLVNDEKFIQNYLISSHSHYRGPLLCLEKLQELGLEKEKILHHLEMVEESVWENQIRELVEKKLPNETKRKQVKEIFSCVRMIIAKGYPINLIRRVLSEKGVPGDLLEELELL